MIGAFIITFITLWTTSTDHPRFKEGWVANGLALGCVAVAGALIEQFVRWVF